MNAGKILAKLVAIDTTLDRCNREIVDFLDDFLRSRGFVIKKIKEQQGDRVCLWGKLGSFDETGLAFVGHTDTVPAGSGWQQNPYELTKKGDKLIGLGANDMKGGIAAFLEVVSKIKKDGLKKNIQILFTYDEEREFSGIKDFLSRGQISADLFVIGEPTNNIPVVGCKGLLAMRIEFFGKAAHGSVPHKGENAIFSAMKFLEEVRKYSVKIEKETCSKFDPAWATFNLGKIEGGDAINKVPANCLIEVEWRTVGKNQKEELCLMVKRIIKKSGFKAKVEILSAALPMIGEGDFINSIEKLLGEKAKMENYITEGSFLDDKKVLIIGPGPFNPHVANEFVSEKSMRETGGIYEKLIKKHCYFD